jgi:nitrite reductase (cytochrome c-552)
MSAKFAGGSHAAVANECLACHPNGEEHLADVANVRAEISFSLEQCAACHADQHDSYVQHDAAKPGHFGGSIKSSKYEEFPHYQFVMGGHGFTKEYTEDREHAFLLKDHIDTQRKQATTCLQCKSSPVTYYWNESRRGSMQFDKSMPWADVIAEIADKWPETIDYGAGCTHCHDPHSGDFRLIRKGVMEAILERGTDPYTASLNVIPGDVEGLQALMNTRGTDGRRTAQAMRLAGTLTCGQCHIEYVCGQGADKETTGEIRDDVPWRKLPDIEAYYQEKFALQQDWTHSVTGATGIKSQHPELESYWESTHHKLGLSCADCHMEKVTDDAGTAFTSHWLTSPLKHANARCTSCHENAAERMFSVQDEIYADARTVEDLLNTTLQSLQAASSNGLASPENLAEARTLYMRALSWWEWTAVSENSMGLHNWSAARQQLDTAADFADEARLLLP